MTDLYRRVLLWHKLLAMQTGALALCSAKHRLNRDEAGMWSSTARNVADDIDAFLKDGSFVLDDRGQRMVGSVQVPRPAPTQARPQISDSTGAVGGTREATSRKAGGLRVATRKK